MKSAAGPSSDAANAAMTSPVNAHPLFYQNHFALDETTPLQRPRALKLLEFQDDKLALSKEGTFVAQSRWKSVVP